MTRLLVTSARGFTLLEAIIYLGLTSFLLTGIIAASYPLFTNTERTSAAVLRDLESAFVFQKVAHLMNGASSISVSGGDTLTVDGSVMTVADGVVTLDGEPLTASRVEITNLSFALPGDVLTVNFDANGVSQGPYVRYVRVP